MSNIGLHMLSLPTEKEKEEAVLAAYEKLSDEEKKDIDKIAANFVEAVRVKRGGSKAPGFGPKSAMPALGVIAMYIIIYELDFGEDYRAMEKDFWKVPPTQVYR